MSEPRTLSRLAAAFSAMAWVPDECTAGSDVNFSSSVLAQPGQTSSDPGRTRSSNSRPQLLQVYSKIGIVSPHLHYREGLRSPTRRRVFLLSWTALLATVGAMLVHGQAPPVTAISNPPAALEAAVAPASRLVRLRSLLVSHRGEIV